MAIFNQIVSALLGAAMLYVALDAFVTRRVDVGEDAEHWLIGWKAVVYGCVALATAVFCFAGALNFIHADWWH